MIQPTVHSRIVCRRLALAALLITHLTVPTVASGQSPSLAPAQESVDIHLAGRLLGRYVTAYDTSSPQRKKETYKPFLHLFDPEGHDPITKGPGGDYTHHRGIFIGWFRIGFEGQTIDRWHMIGGEQVVQGKVDLREGKDCTTAESTVHWNDGSGKPFIVETRTFTFRTPPAPAYLLVDFQSRLETTRGEVKLDGDPEHAGVHFRPSDALDRKTTVFLLPGSDTKAQKSTDLPWIAESFMLNGRTYSVVQFNHPENPPGTRSSAYRDYGRMGMFPTATIPAGGNLVLRYRFLVSEGAFPEVPLIQSIANSFTGGNEPVPAVTRRQADVTAAPKPRVPKTTPARPSTAPEVDSSR